MDELNSRQIMGLATIMVGLVSLILLSFWSLLMRAKSAEARAHQGRQYARGILDSIPSQIAVLDRQGIIVDVNQAWRNFSLDNSSKPGVPSPNTGVGTNYLDVCGSGDEADSPSEKRWFMMTVTPLQPGQAGAVVTHYNITDRKLMELKIQHLAFLDGLTQLPNRRLFNDRLGHALAASKRSGQHGALVMLDLDNFKSLNDQHGHAAGDLLLIEVARRLQSHVREEDTVARLGAMSSS